LAISWAATLYIHFRGLLPTKGILPDAKFALHPSVALSYIVCITAHRSSSGREPNFVAWYTRNGIKELLQRTPPIFVRVAVTFCIGQHSSSICFRLPCCESCIRWLLQMTKIWVWNTLFMWWTCILVYALVVICFACKCCALLYCLHYCTTALLLISYFYGRPMELGRPLYFHPVVCSFSFFFFSSPNLSRRRVDVCHTCTHGVALVQI